MNDPALIATLQRAGFKGQGLRTAYAIAHRESGGRADAFNGNAGTGDKSYGLFQINMLGNLGPARRQQFGLAKDEDLLDPLTNARAAYQLSKGGTDFGAWGIGPNAYRSGAGFDTIQGYFRRFPSVIGKPQLAPKLPTDKPQLATGAKVQKGGQTFGGAGTKSPQQRMEASTGEDKFRSALSAFFLSRAQARMQGQNPQGGLLELAQLRQEYMTMGGVPEDTRNAGAGTGAVAQAKVDAGTKIDGGSTKPTAKMGEEASGTSDLSKKILTAAHSQVGKPYVWGAESPAEGGFDCSGLIDWAYKQAGIDLPGRLTTYTAKTLGKSVKGQSLQPGDMVITNGGEHMVMYVGDGQVIAAPHTGTVVQYQPLSRFDGDIVDVRRVIP